MDSRELALRHICLDGRGLEIGPSYNPLVTKASGARIETVDHADQQTLLAKYAEWGVPPEKLARIEPVDHLWSGGSLLEAIPHRHVYDYIVASHVLEHTVDLVGFLHDCADLLTDSGRLALVLPDKRFCFDRFQPLSSVGDVVDAFHAPNRFHTAGTLLDHHAYACTWGDPADGPLDPDNLPPLEAAFPNLEHAADVIAAGQAQREYLDVHHWKFTPTSFQLLMSDLGSLGYHPFGLAGSDPTEGFEFFVTLDKSGRWPQRRRIDMLLQIEDEISVELAPMRDLALAMKASTSWKVTAPLRRLSDVAQSWRARGGHRPRGGDARA